MANAGIYKWEDILIIAAYFIVVLGVGVWSMINPGRGNVQGYFLAGRRMNWFAVGGSLYSSNIGSEHFIGLAGAGAAAGISLILFEWFPAYTIIALGWLFIPVYISAGVYTLPEYIGKRFGGERLRIYLSCVALLLYIIANLAVTMFSGALFIHLALKWNMYVSLVLLLMVTGLYTILGGLTTVMYTDALQTVIMVIGGFVVMIMSFVQIGGYKNLERLYFNAIPSLRDNTTDCGLPHHDAFHVFLDPVTGDQPWPGHVLQASLGCVWYWCCDQVIVQRSLAARSLSHAKGGSLMAGYLKIIPLFLMVFPGMISRILYPDEVACVDPEVCKRVCDNEVGCTNIAYPKLVLEILPTGVRGLVMATMLSAIMGSLTSILNSASTLFTMDVWRKLRPVAGQRELLIVGRLFVGIMCILAIVWVPMIKAFQGGRLFLYINAVRGYIGSPIGILFLLSIFWKRTTEKAAFYGIILGQLAGLARLIVELIYPAPNCGEPDNRPRFLSDLHYSYYVQIQLLFTTILMVSISYFTTPRTDEELVGVTWWTRHKEFNTYGEKTHRALDMEKETVEMELNISGTATCPSPSVSTNDDSSDEPISKTTCGQHFSNLLCGTTTSEITTDQGFEVENTREFLTETKTSRRLLNCMAVALAVAVAFITGFYS